MGIIKDLENEKRKVQEKLNKINKELKRRKDICIGDYGYIEKKEKNISHKIPYLVTKESDNTKFKRYGNIYDELGIMNEESSNYISDDKYKMKDCNGNKPNSKILIDCYNKNEFRIKLRWRDEATYSSYSDDFEIDKDDLYNFILRAKYLLLREHGEEYRIKRLKKEKKEKINRFKNMDI